MTHPFITQFFNKQAIDYYARTNQNSYFFVDTSSYENLILFQKLKIKQDLFFAVFDVKSIQHMSLPCWESVSKFPSVRRDLSIMVKEDVTWNDIKQGVKTALGEDDALMKELCLFDVYQGEHVESGCKSLAMALIFQEKNRTLEDKEVDNLLSKAVSYLTEHLKAEMR